VNVLEEAQRVLRVEADAILALSERIDETFEQALEFLCHCRGKVVLMGMGKSGLIARKIASTFAGTGTPAFFLHPAEGVTGISGCWPRKMWSSPSPIVERLVNWSRPSRSSNDMAIV